MEDVDRLKQATRWMWSLGDYTLVAPHLEPYARQLADACDLRPGTKVLDVAAGNGNFALAAAARRADVTASDITPRMLELGRARIEALGQKVRWVEGDAEALPFDDGEFDVVASTFGAMFAPRPDPVARDLSRVCRSGGLVAMANYSSDGFLGETSALLRRYSRPLPFELPSPFEWGDATTVRRRFENLVTDVELRPHSMTMRFDSVDAAVDFWERTNGPMQALRATVPPERYAECRSSLRELVVSMNSARNGVVLGNTYLEVLARK